jgi:hypothetical protein
MRNTLTNLVLLTGILSGCSATVVHNYSPSSNMSVNGALEVGTFKYLPAEQDKNFKPNQIQVTAPFQIYLENPIHKHFEGALFKESRSVGIVVKESTNLLHGEIQEFSRYHGLLEADFTLKVRYVVSTKDSKSCYDKVQTIKKTTDAGYSSGPIWNEVIKLNIEKAFQDSQFVSCIHP